MNLRVGIRVLWLGAALAFASPGRADGRWSATVGATTDYVFRGVSQTYGAAALQVGANYQSPRGWFVGVWGSNVDPYPYGRRLTEFDAYAGYGWSLATDWTARATYTRYTYLDDHRPRPYDYGEIALSVSYEDRVTATVSYAPDSVGYSTLGYAHGRPTRAYELAARWPLGAGFAVTGGAGYYDLSRLFGARYWAGSVGAAYARGRWSLALDRFSVGAAAYRLYDDSSADGEWVLSGAWRF